MEEKLSQTSDWALTDERIWIWGEGKGVAPDRVAACWELWRGGDDHAYPEGPGTPPWACEVAAG